jgi:hypothetical protein
MNEADLATARGIACNIIRAWFTNDGEYEYKLQDWTIDHDNLATRFAAALQAQRADLVDALQELLCCPALDPVLEHTTFPRTKAAREKARHVLERYAELPQQTAIRAGSAG